MHTSQQAAADIPSATRASDHRQRHGTAKANAKAKARSEVEERGAAEEARIEKEREVPPRRFEEMI
jgi:hypothetical protein